MREGLHKIGKEQKMETNSRTKRKTEFPDMEKSSNKWKLISVDYFGCFDDVIFFMGH